MTYEENMIEMIKSGGCFVNTRVGLYRANKKLTAEELGIQELPKKIINLGSIKLLPDEICAEMKLIRSIENRVNGLVNLRTFEFEGFGRYLKNGIADTFAREIEELHNEFNAIVDTFEEHYPTYIEDSVEFWGGHADHLGVERHKLEQAVREAFIEDVKLREKFKFIVTYLKIPDPAADAWKNCEAEYHDLSQGFLEETMRQMRFEAFRAMDDMASAISSEKWNQKTLNKLPKMLERIEAMAIVPDEQLSAKIKSFQEEFITLEAKDFKKEDGEEAFKKLQGGLRTAVSELKELADADMKAVLDRKLDAGGGRMISVNTEANVFE